jgi:UDP-N-acetylglucosamine 3-dehydrogenase
VFGVEVEGQGVSHFRFQNGVMGMLTCSLKPGWDCWIRMVGNFGIIELSLSSDPRLKLWGAGMTGWEAVQVAAESSDLDEPTARGVLDLIDALETGREPELSGRRALRATELIFATYESARRRARVDLPLQIEDNPYLSLLAEGQI